MPAKQRTSTSATRTCSPPICAPQRASLRRWVHTLGPGGGHPGTRPHACSRAWGIALLRLPVLSTARGGAGLSIRACPLMVAGGLDAGADGRAAGAAARRGAALALAARLVRAAGEATSSAAGGRVHAMLDACPWLERVTALQRMSRTACKRSGLATAQGLMWQQLLPMR